MSATEAKSWLAGVLASVALDIKELPQRKQRQLRHSAAYVGTKLDPALAKPPTISWWRSYVGLFTNELGNQINVSAWNGAGSDGVSYIRVRADGPTSQLDHTWTAHEAGILVEAVVSALKESL